MSHHKDLTHFWIILFCLIGSTFIATISCNNFFDSNHAETRINRFEIGESPILSIQNFNGDISITTSGNNYIEIQATLLSASEIDYQATQDENKINVVTQLMNNPQFKFGPSPSVKLEIITPSRTEIQVATQNGDIEVSGIEKSGNVFTANGEIFMGKIKGIFNARTMNGSIEVNATDIVTNFETSNGSIKFQGEFKLDNINFMKTFNGNIHVHLNKNPDIRIDASTLNGTVSNNVHKLRTFSADKHRLLGGIGQNRVELYIQTNNGSITIK